MMLFRLLLLVQDKRKKKMAESRYDQFKKYLLFQQDFLFSVSLYFIFNEENAVKTVNNEFKFILTYQKFKQYLVKLRKYAKNSCGIKCQNDEMCLGHQTLDLMEKYDDFIFDSVERRGLYYKHVKFVKVEDDNNPMLGFKIIPINEVDLSWKSWSQRMSYLVI